MAFNISEFSNTLASAGGVNGSNRFLVRITPPSGLDPSRSQPSRVDSAQSNLEVTAADDSQLLQFLCDSTNLPGSSLQVLDYKPQGFGKTSKIPYGISFDSLSLTFMLDSDHRVLYFYELWLQEIVNIASVDRGENATYNNRTSFEFNYKKNYTATIELIYFSADNGKVIKYKFFDAYPIQKGSVQLAWEANDQIAKLPVEFSYTSYTVFEDLIDFPVSDTRGDTPLYELGSVVGGGGGGALGSALSIASGNFTGSIQNSINSLTSGINNFLSNPFRGLF
jgi:hypothetical protein